MSGLLELARLERAYLRRWHCGWCDANLTAKNCQAMFGDKCDMDERRADALKRYKPRTRAAIEGGGR